MFIQSYKFTVESIKGSENVGADFLSRVMYIAKIDRVNGHSKKLQDEHKVDVTRNQRFLFKNVGVTHLCPVLYCRLLSFFAWCFVLYCINLYSI